MPKIWNMNELRARRALISAFDLREEANGANAVILKTDEAINVAWPNINPAKP
jgi:hypothetical protein